MRLFYLVEQDYAVRMMPNRFGQLAAFVVTYVSRRRAYEPADGVFFLVFRHIDTYHRLFVVEQQFRQRLCQFGLAHSRSTEEHETSYRFLRVLKPRAAAPHGVRYGRYGLVLAYDALMQFLFQMQQFFAVRSQHLAYRDAGPFRYHFRNVFRVDFFLYQGLAFGLHLFELVVEARQFVLRGFEAAVAYLGHFGIIGGAFGFGGLVLELFDLFHRALYVLDHLFFHPPFGVHFLAVFLKVGQFLV